MPSSVLVARRPRGTAEPTHLVRDPEILASFLEDAAHFPQNVYPAVVNRLMVEFVG